VFLVKKKDNDKIYAMKVLKKEQIAAKNLWIKTKGIYFYIIKRL
jgi:hypothetical protein